MTQHHQSGCANVFVKYRKSWLLLVVGLAVGLNVCYARFCNPSTRRASGLFQRSRDRPRLEPQEGNQPSFLYSKAGEQLQKEAVSCHAENDADYYAEEVLRWGSDFLASSPEQCCEACQSLAGCNVWVYCAKSEGSCPDNHKPQECWLKKKVDLNLVEPQGQRIPGSGWVSGALFSEEEYKQAVAAAASKKQTEEERLTELRNNETLPLVFFDVTIKGEPKGRIEMVLFPHIAPRAAENFRQLCTGEHGVMQGGEGPGLPYHFKGASFYRIIHQFIDQGGVNVDSVFGGPFKDDPGGLQLKHIHKGLLSMANLGPDTNTAHFSIMINPAPHLDGHYTIFGQVVSGFEVVDAINALSVGKPENTAGVEEQVVIAESGQLRKGTVVPDLTLGI